MLYNIRQQANMLLPPHSKVAVGCHIYADINAQHVQYRETILTDSDFSEGEHNIGCVLVLRRPYGKSGLIWLIAIEDQCILTAVAYWLFAGY